jgi:hypothetical protein
MASLLYKKKKKKKKKNQDVAKGTKYNGSSKYSGSLEAQHDSCDSRQVARRTLPRFSVKSS